MFVCQICFILPKQSVLVKLMPTLPWHETIESADVGSTGIVNSHKLTTFVSMSCEKNVLGWEIILLSGLVKASSASACRQSTCLAKERLLDQNGLFDKISKETTKAKTCLAENCQTNGRTLLDCLTHFDTRSAPRTIVEWIICSTTCQYHV